MFARGSGEFTRHVKDTACRPYACKCGKLFKKKSSLKVHKSTHSKNSFTCFCGNVFRCEQYLKNHQRRVHGKPSEGENSDAKSQEVSGSPNALNERIVDSNCADKSGDESEGGLDPFSLLMLQMASETAIA